MATITVRIDDATRDALQEKAENERQTLSEYVRDRLQDAVYGAREPERETEGLQPETMSAINRHTLALLHRILARVLPEGSGDVDGDEKYQLDRARVLEEGYTKEYWVEFAGIRTELNGRQCDYVKDVLDLFRIAGYSITHIRKDGGDIDEATVRTLTFHGFDHNDELEGQMSDYVRYLVESGKWSEQKEFVLGDDHGNSHSPMYDTYSRMLSAWREVKQRRPRTGRVDDYLLTKPELEYIAQAWVHPSNR